MVYLLCGRQDGQAAWRTFGLPVDALCTMATHLNEVYFLDPYGSSTKCVPVGEERWREPFISWKERVQDDPETI